MSENIKANSGNAEADAALISGMAQYFQPIQLVSIDSRTTITANGKSKEMFQKRQATMNSFGIALEKEANNIRSLNISFKEYDQMMALLMEKNT